MDEPKGGCTTIASRNITIFVCRNIEERWHEQMAEQHEEDYAVWLEEQAREDALHDQFTLHSREPEMFAHRADTDALWPPPELDPFEECERDPALVYDLSGTG